MNNDQSYLDNGELRDVQVVEFFGKHMSEFAIVIGQSTTYAEAVEMVKEHGFKIAPEGKGFDCGHIASTDESPDAYGIPVFVRYFTT